MYRGAQRYDGVGALAVHSVCLPPIWSIPPVIQANLYMRRPAAWRHLP